jgi:ATP synthase protein I
MWRLAAKYGAIGIEFAIAIGIGFLVGRWLDEKAGTEPYLMVLFVILGAAAGIKALVRVARKIDLDRM